MASIKSLAKDTAVYGLSSIIGRFLNWCMVPLYTLMFPAEEYGVVTYLYSYVALALIILTYGMETGFFRFANNNSDNPMRVYSTSLISLATTSTLFMVFLCIFISPVSEAMNMSANPDYVIMLALTVAIDAFTAMPFAYLRYQNRAMRFAVVRLINIGVNIGLNLFFLLLCPIIYNKVPEAISWFYIPDYGIGYIFVANMISSVLTLVMLVPQMRGFKYEFDYQLLRRMIKYSLPLLVLGVAGIMNQTFDKILLPELVSDASNAMHQVGIYGANYKIAIVMVMFIQAFRFAYEPFIFSQNKQANDSDKLKSYVDAMKYFIIFSLLIFLTVMFYLPVLKYFIAPAYFEGLKVVPIIMLAELFFGIFFNLSLWYKLTDQTQWGMYFSLIGLAVTVILNVALVPRMGYMGCAIAAICCYGVMMVASYVVGRKRYPINYDMRNAAFYSVVCCLLYIIGIYMPVDNEIVLLALRTVLLAVFVAIALRRENIPLPKRLIGKK